MSQVSKRKVHHDIEEKMYETLWEAISQLKSRDDIQNFLNDLFSPVERQMITKRIAIAALLIKGYGYEAIQDLLKVSDTTVAKVSLILKGSDGYKTVINKIARSEASRAFWQDLENLFYRLSSPHNTFAPESLVKYKLGHKRKTLL